MPDAVIFDFDGVLVDTEPVHFLALRSVLAPLGLDFDWPHYLEHYIGLDDRGVFRAAFQQSGQRLDPGRERELIAAKGRAFADAVRRAPPPALPGVESLLRELHGHVPLALCSGALPADIEPVLQQRNWTDVFEVRVTAADVAESKPNPTSYALALRRLQDCYPDRPLPAHRCVAVEDTDAGETAARGAGLAVVRVAGRGNGAVPAGGVWKVPSLEVVSKTRLDEVFGL